ncbi:MAG: hypothetical protein ABIR84_09385 [Candidatus Nitrotoga sp.]
MSARHQCGLIAAGLSPFAPETVSVEFAIARVAERVKQGGHNIPEPVIRRRFASGRKNFDQHYRALVDAWALYDNSGEEPQLMEWGEK